MAFQCVVVTPDVQLFDAQVSQVILPAHDGQMGILTDRAPMLARLGLGQLRVDVAGGASQTFLVDGGVAQKRPKPSWPKRRRG
jgi:F-type H+-transporting ATPase subunit epsilon